MAGIPLITHKRGDTFEQVATLPASTFADGYFVGWSMACQVRDPFGVKYGDAALSWLDPATTRDLLIEFEDTSAWPVSGWPLQLDVQFTRTSDGFVESSNTQYITVIKDVTYGV